MKIYIFSEIPLNKGKCTWSFSGYTRDSLYLVNKGIPFSPVSGTSNLWLFNGSVGWIKKGNKYAILVAPCNSSNNEILGIFLYNYDYTSAPQDRCLYEVPARALNGMIDAKFGVYRTGAKIFARYSSIYTLSDNGWLKFIT